MLEEPDRVPVTDLGVSPVLIAKLLSVGGAPDELYLIKERGMEIVKGYKKLGMDLVVARSLDRPDKRKYLDKNLWVNEWGWKASVSDDGDTQWWRGSTWNSIEEWDSFEAPPPTDPQLLGPVEEMVEEARERLQPHIWHTVVFSMPS